MLEYLRIRDLALIADMELEFTGGMNVLTGETGAGKSFILKAIDFLMGERLTTDMIRPGSERAQVEALFSLADGDMVLRRELVAETGRSRFFVNDSLSSQEAVKNLRSRLVMHTSQHGQQRLLQPSFQTRLIDDWMQQPALIAQRDELLRSWRSANEQYDSLNNRVRDLADRRELMELQLQQITTVDPEPGEEERLENTRNEIRAQDTTKKQFDRALSLLRDGEQAGLLTQLGSLEQVLDVISENTHEFKELLESASQFRIQIQELDRSLRSASLPAHDYSAEELESRLFELAQLKRKFNRSLPEILSLRDEIEEDLSFLDVCGLDLRQLEKERARIGEELARSVAEINTARKQAAASFIDALQRELMTLGFSEHVRVMAEPEPFDIIPGCQEERVRLLWAPNPGQPPQPLDRIASGGELSRFMLAVVSLNAKQDEATLIFDEVDAGVGGITLNRVGERLSDLASARQMLLITHWPQLAERASRHFQVSKTIEHDMTFTRCVRLEETARKTELARMAGIES